MDFFISNAYAQQAAPQGSLIDLWPLVVIFIAFYFLLIRPQQKKQKAHTEMVGALQVGDEVMTAGGILGRITAVSDHYAVVQISEHLRRSLIDDAPSR
jgi:preprotein translocase subunit YajC